MVRTYNGQNRDSSEVLLPGKRLLPMLCALLFLSSITSAQSVSAAGQIPGRGREDTATASEKQRQDILKEMAKKANKERQAELVRDTDKLFELASQLKEYVDKTNENVMSLDVMKKAAEIEKLAHSVKEKMKAN